MITNLARSFSNVSANIKRIPVSSLGTKEARTEIIDCLHTQKLLVLSGIKEIGPIGDKLHDALITYPTSKLGPPKKDEMNNGIVVNQSYHLYGINTRDRGQPELADKHPDFRISRVPEHPGYLDTFIEFTELERYYMMECLKVLDDYIPHHLPKEAKFRPLYELVRESDLGSGYGLCYETNKDLPKEH